VIAADRQQHFRAGFDGDWIEQLHAAAVVADDHVARTIGRLQPATGQAAADAAGHTAIEFDVAAIDVENEGAAGDRRCAAGTGIQHMGTLAAVEPAQTDALQADLRRFAADTGGIGVDLDTQHPTHPARARQPPVVTPVIAPPDAQGDRCGVAGQRGGKQMAHQIAAWRQLEFQRRFGGFSPQRQFVAFDGQAGVRRAVEIDIELVRRQIKLRRAAGEGVQLDFLQRVLAHG